MQQMHFFLLINYYLSYILCCLVNPQRDTWHSPSWIHEHFLNSSTPKCVQQSTETVSLFTSLGECPWSRSPDSCCMCCSLEKSDLMNVRQSLPHEPAASPTCHLALSVAHTEAPGTSKMGSWFFSYGRLAIKWLGHELSAGWTLSDFTF